MSDLVEKINPKSYKETRRRYYLKNKEKIDLKNKMYNLTHKDQLRDYRRRWGKENADSEKAKMDIIKDTPEFKQKRSSYNKKYRGKYKDKLKEYYSKNREKILTRNRNNVYQKEFGITIEDYDRMLIAQDYKCATCGATEAELGKRFSVDHCHKTGKVRGLLCGKCNSVLGFVKDSKEILSNCITYLNKFSA